MSKHLDQDLLKLLEVTVPPCQIESITLFRSVMFKYRRALDEKKEQEAQQLQEHIDQLDTKKKVAKVDIELANLTSWAEKLQEESNRQAGLSVQYLHTRFEKGKEKVNAFSAKSHRYITGENFLAGPAEIQRISGRFGTNQPYLGRAFVFQDGLN